MMGRGIRWAVVSWIALVGIWAGVGKAHSAQAAPQGQVTWAIHFKIAPTYFDPAEHQGIITSEWGESENKRKAKFYSLTAAGRRRLKEETAYWRRFSEAIGFALEAMPEDL